MSIVQASKRQRTQATDLALATSSTVTLSGPTPGDLILAEDDEEPRTSSLQAPIMLLSGQEAAVYCFGFSPAGDVCASAGVEKAVYLWDVYGECQNYNVLRGHSNAVTQLSWLADGRQLATSSADKTVMLWDCHKGRRKRKWTGHGAVVNCCAAARAEDTLATGADDGQVLLWDARERKSSMALANRYSVTCAQFSDDATKVFCGGIDDKIYCWDLRNEEVEYVLEGHADTVTGLALSPDGTTLLSNAMDQTLKTWDVRPLGNEDRALATFEGHQHDFHKNLLRCAWSSDGEKVTCGSSDQVVHIWDVATTEELYYLPGHKGPVNDVDFHPKEPIVGSASSDKTVYLGEIA